MPAPLGRSDYVHQNTTSFVWSTDAERRANRVKRTFETRDDSLVEGNETFTARFSPTSNVVDRDDPDRDEKCEITIIDDDPNITSVEVTSDPGGPDDTYGVDETIEISATFSTSVDVDGNPRLGLRVGDNWRPADYLRGSGSDTLVFGYQVKAEDEDDDGISMGGGYQDSAGRWHNFGNHTAITAVDTDTVAYRVYSGIDDQSGHKVDGTVLPGVTGIEITSSPASGDTYGVGETIVVDLTFTAPVDVSGNVLLNGRLEGDNPWRGIRYSEGSGTETLVFNYTVESRDRDHDGIKVGGGYFHNGEHQGFGGSGEIRAKGTETALTPTFNGLTDQPGHKLDGSLEPFGTSTLITSSPASGDTYRFGESIEFSITFSAPLEVEGEGRAPGTHGGHGGVDR